MTSPRTSRPISSTSTSSSSGSAIKKPPSQTTGATAVVKPREGAAAAAAAAATTTSNAKPALKDLLKLPNVDKKMVEVILDEIVENRNVRFSDIGTEK